MPQEAITMSIRMEVPDGTGQNGNALHYQVKVDDGLASTEDPGFQVSLWTSGTVSSTVNGECFVRGQAILQRLKLEQDEQIRKSDIIQNDKFTARATILRLAQTARTFVVLLPTKSGYVNRSDFLEYRLQGSKLFEKSFSFVRPCQHIESGLFKAGQEQDEHDVLTLVSKQLRSAIGAVVLNDDLAKHIGAKEMLHTVIEEMRDRLSFPWLLKEPLARQRIAWVDGRKSYRASDHIWSAAAALGIDLVILDKPGHWLEPEDGPYSHLRQAFLPVDITADPGLAQRLARAIQSYPKQIDGIATVSDLRLAAVAQAAEILGLPASPSSSFQLAMDKHKTRAMEEDHEGTSSRFTTIDELQTALAQTERPFGSYPLIVKPCLGWSSEGVTKVMNDEELVEAFARATSWRKPMKEEQPGILIEPYIDGPEFDANFVLQDGKVLFCEIGDNFPGAGDGKGYHGDLSTSTGSHQNFQETEVIYPSSLPTAEQNLIKKSIEKSIVRQGFRNGVFHCEGRLKHSTVEYQVVSRTSLDEADTLIDLGPIHRQSPTETSVYLLEINARPPGYPISPATKLGCGVDYYALQLLQALPGETASKRYRALAQSFLNGPQYQVLVQQFLPSHGGIMRSVSPWSDLEMRRPDLANTFNVPLMIVYSKAGDKVAGPGEPGYRWVAYGVIVSRGTRDDVQILARDIRREFRYVIE